jgi:hypothetical protein
MGWTAPRTWVTGEIPTGSMLNTHLRDDLTALQAQSAVVATSQTSASLSYTDLATTGPALTLVTGTQVLITCGSDMAANGTAAIYMSPAVSGATTLAPVDATAVVAFSANVLNFFQLSYQSLFTGLTAGTNTFTSKYKVTGNTGTWVNRNLVVEACY